MKKSLFIAATAALVLASCAKVDNVTVVAPDQAISFEPVNGMSTKALTATQSSFPKTETFHTFAWYLEQGKTWADNSGDAVQYIIDEEVSYVTADDIWKVTGKTYYWPKAGNLTFFSYYPSSVTVATDFKGIKTTFTADGPTDFMVADIITDQTDNKSADILERDGVKTLFRHKLTNISFSITTDKDYGTDNTIVVNSIKVKNVSNEATYENAAPADEYTPDVTSLGAWKDRNTANNEYAFTIGSGNLSKDTALSSDAKCVIPQSFADENAVIEIVYTTTLKGTSGTITDVCTVTKALKDITADWNINTKIVYDVTIGLDQILWDPAIEAWVEISGSTVTI